jgi:hypothetical protein
MRLRSAVGDFLPASRRAVFVCGLGGSGSAKVAQSYESSWRQVGRGL